LIRIKSTFRHEKNCLLVAALQLFFIVASSQTSVQNLLTENKKDPAGLGVMSPRFSWQLASDKRNTVQTAYEIKLIADDKTKSWNSGKINSDQSVQVAYTGPALVSNAKYQWQVRVWDQTNTASAWSTAANFQMGLLQTKDWIAQWIEPGFKEDPQLFPSPLFRHVFNSTKKSVLLLLISLHMACMKRRSMEKEWVMPI